MSGQGRVADALIRSLGGRSVLLHVAAPAVPGDDGEQLGLAQPTFQDVEVGPAILRKIRPQIATAANERVTEFELLLSSTGVEKVVGSLEYGSAAVLFEQACGVVVDGLLLQITSVTTAEGFGAVYLYRVGLKGSAADLL